MAQAEAPVPSISVALCTYNGAAFLHDQIESVLSQSWRDLELVAVDDASSDQTWPMLQAAAARDARVRVSRNESNLGVAANFIRAMSLCRGKLIAPCDQDDLWHVDKLASLHAALGAHTLVYCDSMLIDEQGRPLGTRVSDRLHMAEGSDPLAFAFWNCISGHAMLFRRELLDWALPAPQVRFHDWWLAFVAASRGSIGYLHEPLVGYRQHAGSQTDVSRRRALPRDDVSKATERVAWLGALAQFPGDHQSLFEQMARLAAARQDQWFCFQWWRLLVRHAPRLMAINRREPFARFALKQLLGMHWRRRPSARANAPRNAF